VNTTEAVAKGKHEKTEAVLIFVNMKLVRISSRKDFHIPRDNNKKKAKLQELIGLSK